MTEQQAEKHELDLWKQRLKREAKEYREARTPKPRVPRAQAPFKWRVTSSTWCGVTRERAEKLANAGEHVDPNPFCNYKKWGLKDLTLED